MSARNFALGPLRWSLPRHHVTLFGSGWLVTDECADDACEQVHCNLILDREHPRVRLAYALASDNPPKEGPVT